MDFENKELKLSIETKAGTPQERQLAEDLIGIFARMVSGFALFGEPYSVLYMIETAEIIRELNSKVLAMAQAAQTRYDAQWN